MCPSLEKPPVHPRADKHTHRHTNTHVHTYDSSTFNFSSVHTKSAVVLEAGRVVAAAAGHDERNMTSSCDVESVVCLARRPTRGICSCAVMCTAGGVIGGITNQKRLDLREGGLGGLGGRSHRK